MPQVCLSGGLELDPLAGSRRWLPEFSSLEVLSPWHASQILMPHNTGHMDPPLWAPATEEGLCQILLVLLFVQEKPGPLGRPGWIRLTQTLPLS